MREVHNRVKNLTNKKKGSKSASECIMDKDGKMLLEDEEISRRWKEYVSELYDDPTRPEATDIQIEEGSPITKEEVKKVIKKMKVGKAPGIDDITTEHLKGLDESGLDKLTELCDLIYNTGYIPDDLKHSLFITIPKKKNAQNSCEFRTISLMSHITKIILSIIILRNKVKLDR